MRTLITPSSPCRPAQRWDSESRNSAVLRRARHRAPAPRAARPRLWGTRRAARGGHPSPAAAPRHSRRRPCTLCCASSSRLSYQCSSDAVDSPRRDTQMSRPCGATRAFLATRARHGGVDLSGRPFACAAARLPNWTAGPMRKGRHPESGVALAVLAVHGALCHIVPPSTTRTRHRREGGLAGLPSALTRSFRNAERRAWDAGPGQRHYFVMARELGRNQPGRRFCGSARHLFEVHRTICSFTVLPVCTLSHTVRRRTSLAGLISCNKATRGVTDSRQSTWSSQKEVCGRPKRRRH